MVVEHGHGEQAGRDRRDHRRPRERPALNPVAAEDGQRTEGDEDAQLAQTATDVAEGDWARTIRTRDFRYTFYADGNGEQMFSLQDDTDEQHNIVADPAYSGTRQELRDRLMELMVMQDYPKTRRELFALGVH